MATTDKVVNLYKFQCHRLDFSANCLDQLEEFSRIHHYDDRKTFKEAWTQWIQQKDVQNMIDEEHCFAQNTQILEEPLSKTILLDKMFKSVRYYHRKKWLNNKNNREETEEEEEENSTNKSSPKQKGFSKNFLVIIDKSIQEQIQQEQKQKQNSDNIITLTQKELFDEFCETYKKEIFEECIHQKEINGPETLNTIIPRLKKTVKNRYYNIRQQYIAT